MFIVRFIQKIVDWVHRIHENIKTDTWNNVLLKRRLETISHQNYERVDIAIVSFMGIGMIGTFVAALAFLGLGNAYLYSWIPAWISFILTFFLAWLFFTQRNLKRITVVFLFSMLIYGGVCLMVLTDAEIVKIFDSFIVNDKTLINDLKQHVPEAIGIIVNSLFLGLVTIQLLTFIYLIFDYYWWKGFVKNRQRRKVIRNSIIHFFMVTLFSVGVLSSLTLITDRINPLIIDTINGETKIKDFMHKISIATWKILNLLLFPTFAIIGRLNMDSALGDNQNLKSIGFKIKIALFFFITEPTNRIIMYIQIAYISISLLTSIIAIVSYFVTAVTEEKIPYMISIFYRQVENITKYELQQMSSDNLKTLGLKHVKKSKYETW